MWTAQSRAVFSILDGEYNYSFGNYPKKDLAGVFLQGRFWQKAIRISSGGFQDQRRLHVFKPKGSKVRNIDLSPAEKLLEHQQKQKGNNQSE